ncbi:hypothetical protein [Niallia sp. Krafla_26]|uniref:hypothetical protein n=1 Tax=Niallia sp. Krafla_26 TaxID=3064703 RepID=UPI003D16F4FC
MDPRGRNKLETIIGHSGNSDVDLVVNVDIDTKAIAYGMLCSLYAKGELTEQELERAVRKLDKLIERDNHKKRTEPGDTKESRVKLFQFPNRLR